jgi:hypothetical protein
MVVCSNKELIGRCGGGGGKSREDHVVLGCGHEIAELASFPVEPALCVEAVHTGAIKSRNGELHE